MWCAWWLLAATVATRPAHAASPRDLAVAVIGIEFEGAVPPASREVLLRRLSDGLTTARFRVVASADDSAAQCQDVACFKDASTRLRAQYLVRGRVREHQKSYELKLEIIDGRKGESVGTSEARCDICGIEEVGERLSLSTSSLRNRLEALANEPGVIVVRSSPEARVSLDGKLLGTTPMALPTGDGEHQLVLEADDHLRYERTVRVLPSVEEHLDVQLIRRSGSFPMKAAGWTAVAVGLVTVAAGVWAVSINGNEIACGASTKDPQGHCPEVHGTAALGAVLIGTGAAAISVGGVWLYLGSKQAPAETAAYHVGLRGRF